MKVESLQCERCRGFWDRPITRGRKPRLCPECISEGTPPVRPRRSAPRLLGHDQGDGSVPSDLDNVLSPDARAERLTDMMQPLLARYRRQKGKSNGP